MFEIYEVSAAPHLPEPLKALTLRATPENVLPLLALPSQNNNVENSVRYGEIFVAPAAS